MNKLPSAVGFRSISNSPAGSLFSVVSCRLSSPSLLSSSPPPSSPPPSSPPPSLIGISLEEKVAASAIRLSFQHAGMKPRLIKQNERPRRASVGIFNTAGYEVLIALFLTSQIPFLSPSSTLSFSLTLFFVSSFKLPVFSVPIFPFSPRCRSTFVLSLSLYFKSVSSFISSHFCFLMCLSCCVSHETGIFSALAPETSYKLLHICRSLGAFIPNCSRPTVKTVTAAA